MRNNFGAWIKFENNFRKIPELGQSLKNSLALKKILKKFLSPEKIDKTFKKIPELRKNFINNFTKVFELSKN